MIRAVRTINNKGMKVTAFKIIGFLSEPAKLRTLQRKLKKSSIVVWKKVKRKLS